MGNESGLNASATEILSRCLDDGVFIPVVASELSDEGLRLELLVVRELNEVTGAAVPYVPVFTSAERMAQAMPGWDRSVNPDLADLRALFHGDAWIVLDPTFPDCLEMRMSAIHSITQSLGVSPPDPADPNRIGPRFDDTVGGGSEHSCDGQRGS